MDLPTPGGDAVGTSVGKYDILEEIGRGGMGVVYLARQRGLERDVALKALHVAAGLGVRAGEALVKESRIAGSLNHPNIVTVYEFLEEGETPYIAMEYVQRGSLRSWMGCMSLAQFTGVFEELLAGLAAVEPSGIVHRDLKPENVMVTADGRVKIADFGIAKATQRAGSLSMAATPTGITVGTPAYMAPEQALCEEVGPATDLYSIGIMAYEHLVGHVPFRKARTPMAILLAHINDPVPAAVEVEPRVDRSLSDWVARLLRKDPAERTKNASAAWDELEEIVIDRLGPMWRREARLTEKARTRISPRRLDPTQFNSQAVTIGPAASVDPVFGTPRLPAQGGAERTLERSTSRVPRWGVKASGQDSRKTLPALAAAAAVALLGGFGVARATDTGSGSHSVRTSGGALSVSLPSGWTRSSASRNVPGYKFKDSLTLRPAGSANPMSVGITSAASAALLPAAVLARGRPAPHGEAVHLGAMDFFRYRVASLGGTSEKAVIYTQPTTAGVLVGVCRLPATGSTSVNLGCEQVMASSGIASAEALPLSQSSRYATVLAQAIGAFNSESDGAKASLAKASTAARQAGLASSLERISKTAAATLRAASAGPSEQPVNATLVAALDRVAAGYATMARGARAEKPHIWQEGATAVRAGSGALQAGLTGLRASG